MRARLWRACHAAPRNAHALMHISYQGRALNHWRHFFSNLCITLQLAQPDHPAGAAEDAERDERERRPHARNVRNTRSMDDQSWEREVSPAAAWCLLLPPPRGCVTWHGR